MRVRLFTISALVLGMIGSVYSGNFSASTTQNPAINKIAPWVIEHTAGGRHAEFLVIMAKQADLTRMNAIRTKLERGREVYQSLYQTAQESQRDLLNLLKSRGIQHRSYYIVNMVWVKGDLETALTIAGRYDVNRIEGNPEIRNIVEPTEAEPVRPSSPSTIEGGITHTRAPEVWALGFTGQGVVVAGADTGYRWDHTAIKNKYRGFGPVVSHDNNWHDSIHSGGGSCGPDSTQPCDDDGHGTHTMGTVLGDDGAGNQVGMAPGAKWIGCRNMNQGVGTPATYIECMEFFLAPYPVGATPAQGNPALAPDVTTNSWTCPPDEGCSPNTLKAAVEAQRAAGILMVVAAGNSGPGCSTVIDPPALYNASYTVGAFDHTTGTIAGFSSRGPVTVDGSNRRKPDISAPGVSIRSSTFNSTTSYGLKSGTSMATPHVAGAVALLWSAQPALKNDVAFTEGILNNAAVDVPTTACSSSGSPNSTYGYGRLDIKTAVDQALPCTSSPTTSESIRSLSASAATGTVNVTAVGGCGWTAISNDASFITVTSGNSGSGSGTVGYSVAENTSSTPRSGAITIAGQTLTVLQGAAFLDVPTNHPFYDEIGKLSARGVTLGCGAGNFCPEDAVTREQMAAFIIRALGDFNPPAPPMQRFLDVPPTNPFYAFIDELAVRQITLGCAQGFYCPSSPVTREQMAAFMIRALGEFNPPTPPSQRFLDVPPSNNFYNFIDRMAVLQITLGCGGGNYCPAAQVTRGQMAAFLVRAFDL